MNHSQRALSKFTNKVIKGNKRALNNENFIFLFVFGFHAMKFIDSGKWGVRKRDKKGKRRESEKGCCKMLQYFKM